MNEQCVPYRRYCIPVAWVVLITVDVCLVALACAQQDGVNRPAQLTTTQVTQVEGPSDVTDDSVRFEAIDVFVDSGDELLAAWQFELASESDGVEIVGIEGGEHVAFREPPYYDTRAMRNNRVILAAFNTGNNLPSGKSRVARIQVQLQGPGVKEYRTKLWATATVDGVEIPAAVSIARAVAEDA